MAMYCTTSAPNSPADRQGRSFEDSEPASGALAGGEARNGRARRDTPSADQRANATQACPREADRNDVPQTERRRTDHTDAGSSDPFRWRHRTAELGRFERTWRRAATGRGHRPGARDSRTVRANNGGTHTRKLRSRASHQGHISETAALPHPLAPSLDPRDRPRQPQPLAVHSMQTHSPHQRVRSRNFSQVRLAEEPVEQLVAPVPASTTRV